MTTQLLEIQPNELKFVFILKKQCSCSVSLRNNTNQYVAFKVKTTSPKKYCVRPNVGIILPKSLCEFTVTMQAQREAPPDMICRDKFLIQSTIVPAGTTDEDITSAAFVKDSGRYIEENKLKVALVSPPHSPVLSPINGTMNQGLDYDASIPKEPVLSRVGVLVPPQTVAKVEESKMINSEDLKPTKDVEWKPRKDMFYAEDLKLKKDTELKPRNDGVNGEDLKLIRDAEPKPKDNFVNSKELKPVKDVESKPAKDVELKPMEDILDTEELKSVKIKELDALKDGEVDALKDGEVKTLKAVEELKLVKDVEEMKSKLNDLESKLGEAEATIAKLTEESRLSTQERNILQEELALMRKRTNLRKVQVGFPLLFVCMVALLSVFLGYLLRR
ncbi:vesicle-associated protein 2-2-like [Herrania umbratica]|uniref:Vesicle-associated protein 2-2-like n=1 Tax=Herrania umbratica TaxID=108875 RepID=A0A6J1A4A0_9ROSI|nr:vesicle-associated protein 2-2-like [Herrania umbratica]XP_021281576.1 vesicle-associated protein 2-2-like [Herrania umbratica]